MSQEKIGVFYQKNKEKVILCLTIRLGLCIIRDKEQYSAPYRVNIKCMVVYYSSVAAM